MAMRLRLIRLRLRRRLHSSQRQVEGFSTKTEAQIEKHLFRRFSRLHKVRRFVIVWCLLLVSLIVIVASQTYLLSSYYQTLKPVAGGIYNEGVIGTFTTANPLYATNDVDSTVSHLIFSSLFKYDSNNQLTSDLAASYTVNSKGSVYTVKLKPNLTWEDGQPLTAKDVVFTYKLIQNPDAQSPLLSSWQGIDVSSPDPQTIVFKLPDPLASFSNNLTNGIVPQHLLKNVPPEELRSANFNTVDPIGSGPFTWQTIAVSGNDPTNAIEQISLAPFSEYNGGSPKLTAFSVHAYADRNQLIRDFKSGKLNGAVGLNEVPSDVAKMSNLKVHNLILTAGVYTFYKTTSGVLSDQTVRTALNEAVDTNKILKNLSFKSTSVDEPILKDQLAYNQEYKQAGYNIAAANNALNQDGWVLNKNGVRVKNNQPLDFALTVAMTPEYISDAEQLQNYWKQVGASVQLVKEDQTDFSQTLQSHEYDAILYGISIGTDPDVYVYWDSSQADIRSTSRLNLSEFKDSTSDVSLQAGRTRLSPSLRIIKYQPFLKQWQALSPALGLYQPRLLYLTNGTVFGLSSGNINNNSDRFSNVQNWEINEAKVTDK